MKPQRKKIAKSSRKAAVLSFLAFGVIALGIVVALEFLDYRAGKDSFIFNKVVRLGRREPAGERFQRDLAALLSAQKIRHDLFRDRAGVTHVKIDLAEPRFAGFARDLLRLVEKRGGLHLLSEVQGMKEQVVYLYQLRFAKRLTHIVLLSKKLAAKAVAAPPRRFAGRDRQAPRRPDEVQGHAAPGHRHRRHRLRRPGLRPAARAGHSADRRRDPRRPLSPAARRSACTSTAWRRSSTCPCSPRTRPTTIRATSSCWSTPATPRSRSCCERAMAVVPNARGLNNHMGSRLTSDPQAIRRLLGMIKERGLFFVDSKTTGETVAFATARALKIRTALRDVFLDDVQTYEHASAQLRRLVELARRNGRALAIGHPFASTLDALRDAVPWLKQQGVDIVPVSEILE